MRQANPDSEWRWISIGLPLCALLGGLGFVIFGATPGPRPSMANAYGCYYAQGGPSFRLSRSGFDFGGHRPLRARLNLAKIGMVLIVSDPVSLVLTADGYHFVAGTAGSGRTYPFVFRSGDKAFYVQNHHQLDAIHITADDGRAFEYRRVGLNDCGFKHVA
jgi:hypothetical protein